MPVQLVEAVITTMVMGAGVNNTDADANGESGDNCNVNKNDKESWCQLRMMAMLIWCQQWLRYCLFLSGFAMVATPQLLAMHVVLAQQ